MLTFNPFVDAMETAGCGDLFFLSFVISKDFKSALVEQATCMSVAILTATSYGVGLVLGPSLDARSSAGDASEPASNAPKQNITILFISSKLTPRFTGPNERSSFGYGANACSVFSGLYYWDVKVS